MGKAKPNTRPAEPDNASNVTSIAEGRRTKEAASTKDGSGEPPKSGKEAALVVFGRDESGKAHASWFGAVDAALATKAAGMMRYLVLPITSDKHRAAAFALPAGRIFASGKGFVPFCKDAVHAALQAFPEAYAPPAPVEPEPEPVPVVTNRPQHWGDLQVGSLVLASTGPDEGWFEAVITEAKGEGIFVLKWNGWPEHDAFVRRADGLALLPAQAAEAA